MDHLSTRRGPHSDCGWRSWPPGSCVNTEQVVMEIRQVMPSCIAVGRKGNSSWGALFCYGRLYRDSGLRNLMNTEVEIRIQYTAKKFLFRGGPIGFSRKILFHKDGVINCLYSNDNSHTWNLLNIIGYQKNAKLSRPQILSFPKIIKPSISFRA